MGKQASFKPVTANFDIDIGSFSQPVLRRLAHYYLHMPLYVSLLFILNPCFSESFELYSCRRQMVNIAIWRYAP